MTFTPVVSGRVPFAYQTQMAAANIAQRQRELTDAATELSTGRRLSIPSQNPNEAIRATLLQRAQEQQTQFRSNVKQGADSLSFVDNGLRSFSDALDSVRSLAVSVADGTKSDADYEAARSQVDAIIDQLVTVANQQYLDRYSFSGGNAGVAPFRREGSGIVFTGDSDVLQSLQGSGQLFPASVTADSSIGVFSSAGYGTALSPTIAGTTRLSSLNRGTGIDAGAIRISTGVGSPVEVDLSNADSVQDVIDLINQNPTLSSQGFTVGIAPSGQSLRVLTGPTATVSISEANGGTTAGDLGISLLGASIPVTGQNLNAALTLDTPLSRLNGGAGVNTTEPLVINNGPYSASINLSSATTVEDVLNAINSSGTRVRAEINRDASSINVLNTLSGSSFSIIENSATGQVAQGLGILTTNLSTPLADFKGRSGVQTRIGPDIRITVADGSVFDIDLDGAKTVRDVQQKIASATGSKVSLSINPVGGLKVDDNTTGAAAFTVSDIDDSQAASDLGITGSAAAGGTILGSNNHQARVKGIFDTLLRIRDGLLNRNIGEVSVAAEQIDSDQSRLLSARGSLGAQLQMLDQLDGVMTSDLERLKLDTTKLVDADLSETVTKLQAQQTALQAALASSGRLLQGSLLDYL